MSKRKDKNKNKKEEPTIPEKYVPENQIETFEEKVGKNLQNEDLLSEQMTKLNEKFNELHINHIKNTEKLNKNLEDKQRENAYLYEEIREIRDQKEEFERSCKENFEKKFEEVEEEKMNAIEEIAKTQPKENAGPRTSKRFEYQMNWGLKKLLDLEASGSDYTIAFDYHDDIIVFNKEEDATEVNYYQVKTKANGHWRLKEIYDPNPIEDESEKQEEGEKQEDSNVEFEMTNELEKSDDEPESDEKDK